MVGTHKWLYAHYIHPDVILNQFINVPIIDGWEAQMTLCSLHPPSLSTFLYVILNQFINVPVIDGWNAQMTLCSLHPPRRHIESVYQRSYNWWLERTNDSIINVRIIDGWNAHMTLCSLHPPTRHIESVYQRSYNWWLGTHKWLYAHYSHPDAILVYQRSYNWWLERRNDSMLITPPRRHIESVYQRS